jgi:hypothetical protein
MIPKSGNRFSEKIMLQQCGSGMPVCRDRTIIGAEIFSRAMKRLGGRVEGSRASRTTAILWALRNTMQAAPHSF